MKKIIKVILILSIIPLASLLTAFFIEKGFRISWEQVMIEKSGIEASKSEIFQLETFCKSGYDSEVAKEFCEYPIYTYWIRDISILTILIGSSLIIFIYLAGRYSVKNRIFLLKIFKIGIRLTLITLSILIISFSALLIFTIYYFLESFLFGVYHPHILAIIGVGAVIGSFRIMKSSFSFLKEDESYILGKSFIQEELGKFYNLIMEIAESSESLIPKNIIFGLSPTFFVTESPIRCGNEGMFKGTTLYISLPLCRILSKEELKSILCHEMAHFTGDDTKFSKEFYPIYRSTFDSLNFMNSQTNFGEVGFSFYPAIFILEYFYESFALAESKISRERELRADSIAGKIMSNKIFATALIKVHAYSSFWNKTVEKMEEAILQNNEIKNSSESFQNLLNDDVLKSNSLETVEANFISHPTDSHPPLVLRMQNLGYIVNDLKTESKNTNLIDSAISLIPNYNLIEESLTELENENIKKYLKLVKENSIPEIEDSV